MLWPVGGGVGFGALSGSRSVPQIVHVHLPPTSDTRLLKTQDFSLSFPSHWLKKPYQSLHIFCVPHAPMGIMMRFCGIHLVERRAHASRVLLKLAHHVFLWG